MRQFKSWIAFFEWIKRNSVNLKDDVCEEQNFDFGRNLSTSNINRHIRIKFTQYSKCRNLNIVVYVIILKKNPDLNAGKVNIPTIIYVEPTGKKSYASFRMTWKSRRSSTLIKIYALRTDTMFSSKSLGSKKFKQIINHPSSHIIQSLFHVIL